ncbi:hypothetical protein PSECIP111951_00329 [Pseudoalteromonas holothuriae]|uniref:Uncharacterized protein n=1 Tax=Pseudoalteromonas holothuriae TaxID=2963714 RepID=A0ABM9GDM9_9GAMM|nr:hypothetical protein PSECIP111951_00329 [Pseudoalteromonas sp. CIP111951]
MCLIEYYSSNKPLFIHFGGLSPCFVIKYIATRTLRAFAYYLAVLFIKIKTFYALTAITKRCTISNRYQSTRFIKTVRLPLCVVINNGKSSRLFIIYVLCSCTFTAYFCQHTAQAVIAIGCLPCFSVYLLLQQTVWVINIVRITYYIGWVTQAICT